MRAALSERDWSLVAWAVLHTLAYCGFFVVMHLRSRGWAPGQVLDPLRGYWRWFYRYVFAEEQVLATRRSPEATLHPWIMLVSIVLISVVYVGLLYWMRRQTAARQPLLRMLLVLAGLAGLPLLVLPNLLSSDIYSYISFGRIAAVHGGNPFIDPPSAFRWDPFYDWVNWKEVPSVYGPGWIYPSMVLTVIVDTIRSSIITYVLAYKLLALGLHLLNGVLIWKIVERVKPPMREWSTAFYLLNPLALIEFVGNAHNDVLMITFILLAIWLHLRGDWYWTIAALTLAVLTKWIALLLLPLYGLALLWEAGSWRERALKTGAALVIFASLCAGLYRPYWEGPRTLQILIDAPPQQRLINSLGDVVSNDLRRAMGALGIWPDPQWAELPPLFATTSGSVFAWEGSDPNLRELWQAQRARFLEERARLREQQQQAKQNEEQVNAAIRTGALAILALACLVAAAWTRSFRQAILAGGWLFFIYCTIAAVWVWPWYITWFVALAAIYTERVTIRTALLLSLLAPLIYIFYPIFTEPQWWERYRAVMVFLPPLLYAGWHGARKLAHGWQHWRQQRIVAT